MMACPAAQQQRVFCCQGKVWFEDYRMPRECAAAAASYRPENVERKDACYAPIAYDLAKCFPRDHHVGGSLFAVLAAGLMAIAAFLLARRLTGRDGTPALPLCFVASVLLSAPMLFVFGTGNQLPLAIAGICLFFAWKDESGWRRPAALVALFVYALVGSSVGSVETPAVTWQHFVLVLPYVLILVLALVGLNVMLLLFAGTALAAVIGMFLGKFDTFGALDLLGKGTLGMSETLIVAILAGGLFKTIQANGGVLWLTEKISTLVRGPRTCELGMFLLVAFVNLFTANNTVAIVIAGPIAKTCSDRFKADPVRMASVLDTASCIVQGIIPYGAQILIALGIAKGAEVAVGSFDLITCLYYQPLLALAVFLSLVVRPRRAE